MNYDANGNLKKDNNKGITEIKYNYLNLPEEVIKDANHDNTMKDLLVIFFLFFVLCSYSQNKETKYKNVDVNIFKVVDNTFYRFLDEVLQYESRCSYCSDSLPYGIHILKAPTVQGDSVVILRVNGHLEKDIFIWANQHLLGCISYKGHDFFIEGRNILPSIVLTDNKKTFTCRENFITDDDDSWTVYTFIYYDNDFIFYEKINDFRCKN